MSLYCFGVEALSTTTVALPEWNNKAFTVITAQKVPFAAKKERQKSRIYTIGFPVTFSQPGLVPDHLAVNMHGSHP